MAGLALDQARRLPLPGETFDVDGFTLAVVQVSGGTINFVRVTPFDPSARPRDNHRQVSGHQT